MKKKQIVWISVAGAVVVLGILAAVFGPIIYRDVIVGPPVAAPTVQVPSSTATAGASAPAQAPVEDLSGTWKVAADSVAGYRVDEVLNGTNVTVVGRTEQVTGTLAVDTLTLTSAEIEVDVASIATDEGARDNYFRNNALNVSEFPTASFTLLEPVTATTPPAGDEVQTVTVRGELTLNGVTKQIDAEVQAVLSGSGGQVSGSIPIIFADFNVEAPNLGFVSVEDNGSIEFLLNITPA